MISGSLSPIKARRGLRSGLTLIEVLASLVILGGFVAGAGAWLATSARASAALTERVRSDSAIHRALETLRDDLDSSDAASISIQRGGVTMRTAGVLPGEPRGWARVTWRFDPRRGELRRLAQVGHERADRLVLAGLSAFDVDEVTTEAPSRGKNERRVLEVRLATSEAGDPPVGFVWSTQP